MENCIDNYISHMADVLGRGGHLSCLLSSLGTYPWSEGYTPIQAQPY
jgi:hypothetical protein